MAKPSPTSKSCKYCRDNNLSYDITEYWNFYAKKRKDLFGFIDLVVIENSKMIGVQTTTKSNASARFHKITADKAEEAKAWLGSGGFIEIWGWDGDELKRISVLESDIATAEGTEASND